MHQQNKDARRYLVGGFELAQELLLLVGSLETTMSKLAGCIDELKIDLLEGGTAGLRHQGLSEGENPLANSDGTSLDHHKVLVNDTISRKASQWSDLLLGEISGSASSVATSFAKSVNFLVDLGSVMVTVLTGSRHRPLHSAWMPGSDTSNLSQTLVSLAGQTGGSPTGGDTLESLTLGHSDDVNHLILLEDGINRHGLLKEIVGKVNLLG